MRRPKKEIQLTSYDELLGLEELPEKSMKQIMEIELEKIHPFKNHPFRVSDDEKMAETVESIKNYGVLNPALVRPRSEGGYELISGHRRKRGCELIIFALALLTNKTISGQSYLYPLIPFDRAKMRNRFFRGRMPGTRKM